MYNMNYYDYLNMEYSATVSGSICDHIRNVAIKLMNTYGLEVDTDIIINLCSSISNIFNFDYATGKKILTKTFTRHYELMKKFLNTEVFERLDYGMKNFQ